LALPFVKFTISKFKIERSHVGMRLSAESEISISVSRFYFLSCSLIFWSFQYLKTKSFPESMIFFTSTNIFQDKFSEMISHNEILKLSRFYLKKKKNARILNQKE